MSKSYRRPYSPVTGVRSAHEDKTVAARAVRRTQDHTLRNAFAHGVDWDEVLIPHRLECPHNEVYGWSRDGHQRLYTRSSQYDNPFEYVTSPTWMTHDQIIERWEDRKRRDDEWTAYLRRK